MDAEQLSGASRVVARLARQVELGAADAGLTLSQYRALAFLSSGSEAASKLAAMLAVSKPSLTGVIDGLAARGLVVRVHDAGDRRRITLALTDTGREALAAADTEADRRLAEIASHRRDGAESALEAVTAWREALDAYRDARRAEAAAAGAPCETAPARTEAPA